MTAPASRTSWHQGKQRFCATSTHAVRSMRLPLCLQELRQRFDLQTGTISVGHSGHYTGWQRDEVQADTESKAVGCNSRAYSIVRFVCRAHARLMLSGALRKNQDTQAMMGQCCVPDDGPRLLYGVRSMQPRCARCTGKSAIAPAITGMVLEGLSWQP